MTSETSVDKSAFFQFCICFVVRHVKKLKPVMFLKSYSNTSNFETKWQKLDEQINKKLDDKTVI